MDNETEKYVEELYVTIESLEKEVRDLQQQVWDQDKVINILQTDLSIVEARLEEYSNGYSSRF